ncbi:MAG: hypothetical protein AB1726_15945 [Planctomycetota bacterium]
MELARELRERGWTYEAIGRELGYRAGSIRGCLLGKGIAIDRPQSRCTSKWGEQLYGVWKGMRHRCTSRTHPQYAQTGGRGITFGKQWESFNDFYDWSRSSGYRPGLVLLRQNRTRNYTPGNCR